MSRPATRAQLTKLAILFAEAGVRDREDRLTMAGGYLDRDLTSSAQLSAAEAHTLIELLENPPACADCRTRRVTATDALAGCPLCPACLAGAPLTGCHPGGDAYSHAHVEACAAAAVARHQARAGAVPDPPARAEIPPRAVIPAPLGDRYCLSVCYCGSCPHFRALPDRIVLEGSLA